jgi:hypothetical protein
MTPRPSLWQAIAQAHRDLDGFTAAISHGDLCECERCRINQLERDLEPPVTYIKPEDRSQ